MRTLLLATLALAALAGSSILSGCAINTAILQATLHNGGPDEILPLLAKEQVQAANPQGRELILAIIERRKADALRLIEGGADIHATFIKTPAAIYDGYNPILVAAFSGDKDIVKALVDKGADVNYKSKVGMTPMGYATKADMIAFLLDQGATVDKEALLGGYVQLGNIEASRLMLARGADVEKTRELLEERLRMLTTSEYASDPAWIKMIAQANGGIKLLERLTAPQAAAQAPAQAAAGGVTKDELKQMMKEAAAENARPAVPAPAAAEYKSDVDAPAYKASQNPDAFALVVGVEKYNTLPDARFAERDAKAMNAHLLAMGYPQRNIVLLTGSQATKTGLIKNLEAWLPNNVTEKSTVMFYFSGHGAPDAKTSQAYLVPMDGDPQYLEETAYPIKRLYAKLAALKAKRVLVALDSCFSGSGGRSVLAQGTRPLVAKLQLAPVEEKVVSLSASSSDEITGALEEQGHGLFTYHLLKALTETAGRGTVAEVYASLKPRVQDEARRQNRAQTPQAFGRALDGGLR